MAEEKKDSVMDIVCWKPREDVSFSVYNGICFVVVGSGFCKPSFSRVFRCFWFEQNETQNKIQNEKLVGILNTKLMRVEKKRRKKANKSNGDAMEDDEDYDFKVD
ncbi:hypothetical protein RHMOL_Rhmol06G0176800 [Rhododendron molle]|uniref:Uncharacterized protein n=1 Tax=Rhododendron molle TaxID=49168 RepID=A0ACC0NDA5_RHOML|nr:hypothetical protein RHMOL_Rhmol06G0176800 [Rhododendron molle]